MSRWPLARAETRVLLKQAIETALQDQGDKAKVTDTFKEFDECVVVHPNITGRFTVECAGYGPRCVVDEFVVTVRIQAHRTGQSYEKAAERWQEIASLVLFAAPSGSLLVDAERSVMISPSTLEGPSFEESEDKTGVLAVGFLEISCVCDMTIP